MGASRFATFFGIERNIAGLLAMAVLVGMGEKMAERFLPVYVLALGGGALAVGGLNALDNLLSALYAYPGGWLADRIGTKRSLAVFNLMAIAGFALVIAISRWWVVLAASALFLSWTAISLPATMSLIAQVLPRQKRTMGVSMHSLVRRIPMALGPVAGGLLVTRFGERDGVRLAFLAAIAMAVIALFLQQRLIEERPPAGAARAGKGQFVALLGPDLRTLLLADILVRFCEQMPYAFVVIWCMRMHGLAGWEFGVLTAVEMVTAMLVYVPVAWLADRSRKKPFVVITFAFFTAFPALLTFCDSFWPLVAAFVLRGLKEFGEPTRKALIMDLAPDHQKAEAFGFYYLVRDVAVAGGAIAGAFLWARSPFLNLWVASAFGLLGTLLFALRGRDLEAGPA